MPSFITATTHHLLEPRFLVNTTPCSYPPFLFIFNTNTRRKKRKGQVLGVKGSLLVSCNWCSPVMGTSYLEKRNNGCSVCGVSNSGFERRCKKNWENEDSLSLESEILEFMNNSENPEVFPSKKQLIDAGRMDLVEGILKQGGWLSLGWDLDSEEEEGIRVHDEYDFGSLSFKVGGRFEEDILEDRISSSIGERGYLESRGNIGNGISSHVSSDLSQQPMSLSGGSVEPQSENKMGIEGILSRLEKERNMTFGVSLREKESNGNDKDDWYLRNPINETVAGDERSTSAVGSMLGNATGSQQRTSSDDNGLEDSLMTETWRTWNLRRTSSLNREFEAAEIDPIDRTERMMDSSEKEHDVNQAFYRTDKASTSHQDTDQNQIKGRLQHLELELSSVLQSLRSKAMDDVRKNVGSVSDDFQKLSDAYEFQENEIMNAQDKLRSIRAKLAVVEGKMAMAITDAQKIVDLKQKRIDDSRRALRLLCNACIVWPNSASEVLLAGSFDGWATQRKMERSSSGVFSLCLQLYPGRYEIKFIVDGIWRTDPLRPIVNNNGFENNLLIIT